MSVLLLLLIIIKHVNNTLHYSTTFLNFQHKQQLETAYISNIKISKIYNNFSGRVPWSQLGWFVEQHLSLKKKKEFLTCSVTETHTCFWQQTDPESDEINEGAWQIKLDHQYESLHNILTDRSAQFMVCWLAECMLDEASYKTDGVGNEVTRDGYK